MSPWPPPQGCGDRKQMTESQDMDIPGKSTQPANAKWKNSSHIFGNLTAAAAKSLQSCLTLCELIDGSSPGFPIPGIL